MQTLLLGQVITLMLPFVIIGAETKHRYLPLKALMHLCLSSVVTVPLSTSDNKAFIGIQYFREKPGKYQLGTNYKSYFFLYT